MHAYVALLRAINVAGHNRVSMQRLLGLLADLGFAESRSVIQSGSLVFRGEEAATETLEHLLEQEAMRRLGLATTCFVRTEAEWREVIAANPFPQAAAEDPAHLVAMFLRPQPEQERVELVRSSLPGCERMECAGRTLYVVYPDGLHSSRLTGAWIERRLGVASTARNWNSVLRIARMLA